jgi:hypothetical protein
VSTKPQNIYKGVNMSEAINEAGATKFKPAVQNAGVEFVNARQLSDAGTTGEVLIGTLDGSITNQFDGTDYAFTRLSDGKKVIINGCGSLKRQLKDVSAGTLCRVSYNGETKVAKGPLRGKMVHNFLVEIADNAE